MDALSSLDEHLPPMTTVWGIRETLNGSPLCEPVIIIKTEVDLHGYASIVRDVAVLPKIRFVLKFFEHGWNITPRVRGEPDEPVLHHEYQGDNSLSRRLRQRSGIDMQLLWRQGCLVVLHVSSPGTQGSLEHCGLMFSARRRQRELDTTHTRYLATKLAKEITPY